jgi:hypothetical protein
MWVGCFAPVDEQADNLFGRLTQRLTSDSAKAFLADPEINEDVDSKAKVIILKNSGSMARKQTAHPRATIEGRTYHVVLMDESQGLDEKMVNKSIRPMLASTNGTTIMTGTPSYEKGVFYKTIQFNKRASQQRGRRNDHFQADWKAVARESEEYGKFVRGEMLRVGEDSDEFKLSYRLMWMLDRGMFTTSERLDELGDKSMEILQHWTRSPVVIGIDCARKIDSTIVTAVWVDWAHPDEYGYFDHRILNWLDLQGVDWETQYFRIVEFCRNYSIMNIAIDAGGMGDLVASRLRVLMPDVEIIDVSSSRPEQSKRWKHLGELLDRGKISWPAHAKSRRLKVWKRFRQQMEDLEKRFEGPYIIAEAVKEAGAHDDYPDSLALACVLTKDSIMTEVEVSNSPFS